MSYVLALDQGTTSSRAVVYSADGRAVASAQDELTQHFPQPGWVEHDPADLWADQLGVAHEAMARAGIGARDVSAIGITNQRETTLLWDRVTGEPLHRALVWQDRRTAAWCERLRADGHEAMVRERTGLVLDPYFSATKLAWLLDHVEGARERAERGELAFGTVDSWLVWNLTGGRADRGALHATDVTNASRTLLFNLHTMQWDEELLALFSIPRSLLPRVVSSSEHVAHTHPDLFAHPISIAGIAGDQHAATFGQRCVRPGSAKCTYGTGCFLVAQTGSDVKRSDHGLLSTVAWQLGDGAAKYALEGSVFVAGAAVQWLRDGLGVIRSASEVEALAASVEDSGDVVFVPAFAGLGAPHWDAGARGTLVGLTRGTTAAHIARATLDAIALQVADVVEAIARDMGHPLLELRVDGGASANDLLMQLQADVLGIPVVRPSDVETTARGAAYLAGRAVGLWTDADLDRFTSDDARFEPTMPRERAERMREQWARAVDRSRGWATWYLKRRTPPNAPIGTLGGVASQRSAHHEPTASWESAISARSRVRCGRFRRLPCGRGRDHSVGPTRRGGHRAFPRDECPIRASGRGAPSRRRP